MESNLFADGKEVTEEGKTIDSDKIQPVSTGATSASTDISGVVKDVMPSIVSITSMTQQEILSFFGQNRMFICKEITFHKIIRSGKRCSSNHSKHQSQSRAFRYLTVFVCCDE